MYIKAETKVCVSICKSVSLSMYMYTLKQRCQQLRNLVQIFLRHSQSDFLKSICIFFFKKFLIFFLGFLCKLFFYFTTLHLCVVLKTYSSKICCRGTKRDFIITCCRLFTRTHQNLEYSFGLKIL